LASLLGNFENFSGHRLEYHDATLALMVVALDGDALDAPDIEFAGHDGRRHEPPASDGDHCLERPHPVQAPRECAAAAVELVPGDGAVLVATLVHVGSVLAPGHCPALINKVRRLPAGRPCDEPRAPSRAPARQLRQAAPDRPSAAP